MKEDIAELIKEKEKIYQEIKKKLSPLILKFIKEAEKINGYIRDCDLYYKIETFGLTKYDYRRIINELDEDKLIRNNDFITITDKLIRNSDFITITTR